MKWTIPLVVLVLLAPTSAGQWTQLGGDMYRSGSMDASSDTLDVLTPPFRVGPEGLTMFAGGYSSNAALLETPHGVAGVYWMSRQGGTTDPSPGSDCHVFLVRDVTTPDVDEVFDPFSCDSGGRIVGYDPLRDRLLLCIDGPFDAPLLQAWDASTGEVAWRATPAYRTPQSPGALDTHDFSCHGVAIDHGTDEVVAAFSDDTVGRNVVQSIALEDGSLQWATGFGNAELASAAVLGLPKDAREAAGSFIAHDVTLTDTGVIVVGFDGPAQTSGEPAVVWLDRDGTLLGGTSHSAGRLRTGPGPDAPAVPRGSTYASARGAKALMLIEPDLVLIDPAIGGETFHPLPVPPPQGTNDIARVMAAPAWSREALAVPFIYTMALVDEATMRVEATWGGHDGREILQVLLAPPSDAYVLLGEQNAPANDAVLARVDTRTGRTVQYLPLAISGEFVGYAHLLPLADGSLLAWDRGGQVQLLGRPDAARRPSVELDPVYPAVGEPVAVQIALPAEGSPTSYTVAWGTGLIESIAPDQRLTATYDEPRRHTMRVTAHYDDGTTATSTRTVFVGEVEPQDLNALQTAFAPENQDLTFGILGILIAIAGGLIAVARRRRRRNILQRELDAIDEAYAATKDRPVECEAALAERKAHARGLGLDGKLDHSEVLLLERRIDELAQRLRIEAIDERFAFLSVGMARTLREMLADGRISAWEREHFLEVLERDEHLTKTQKGKVERQIEDWFARDEGGAE